MSRIALGLATGATMLVMASAVIPSSAGADLEGVRDCGDVQSKSWQHFIETAEGSDEYRGDFWFVLAGEGVQPSCKFARKWSKRGVREAVGSATKEYRHRTSRKNTPPGWKCWVSSAPEPVVSTGGILECLRYNGKKLIGSFSAGPDYDLQKGPF